MSKNNGVKIKFISIFGWNLSPIHHSRRERFLNWFVMHSEIFFIQFADNVLRDTICWVVFNIGLLEFLKLHYKIFRLFLLISDLSSSTITPTWTGHYFNVCILTFLSLNQRHNFLNVSETITFGHLYYLTINLTCNLDKITVFYYFFLNFVCIQSL